MKLVGYVRVSTKKQLEGGGLQIQKDKIKQYSLAHEHELDKIYEDKGVSAIKERPQFNRMMKELKDVDGVIVPDLTRFGRSITDLYVNVDKLKSQNKQFISVKENIDLSTSAGRLQFNVLSGVAEYERETIRERLESGKDYAREYGTKSGKPMHRPRKDIDWGLVEGYMTKGLSLSAISKIIGVSKSLLYRRDKER